ncbi:MAG: mechanosensitive ion channel family protein [Clostridia bacterium]|nr:mechanosensitive ion channel family protein [Clostridia bacterium]
MDTILTAVIQFLKTAGVRILLAAFILSLGMFLVKKLKLILDKAHGFERLDASTKSFIKNTLVLVMRILVVVTALMALGIPATSFITVLASAGVTIGLALQGSLSNLAGGIMIMFFRPYSVGDHIRAMNTEGVVKEISAFYTTLLTSDNSRVVLPNGTLNNSLIINYSAEKIRRVDLTVTVPMIENADKTAVCINNVLRQNEEVLSVPEPEILLTNLSASTCDYVIRVFCQSDRHDELILTLKSYVIREMEKMK